MGNQRVDTLVIAEGNATGLQIDHAQVQNIHVQEGFEEIGSKILNDQLIVTGFDFIVLLFGHADLWVNMKEFNQKVAMCLQAIQAKNTQALVVVTVTLPSRFDDYKVPGRVSMRNNYLALLVEEARGVEFAKPGKALICFGKVSLVFFDDFGNLNRAGLELVRHGLESKFRCGQLCSKLRSDPFQP